MPPGPDEPVVLVSTGDQFQAEIIAHSLREEGIEARVVDLAGSMLGVWFADALKMINVLVRRDDLDRAREALERIRTESIDIDWSQVEGAGTDDDEPRRRASRWPMRLFVTGVVAAALAGLTWLIDGFGELLPGSRP